MLTEKASGQGSLPLSLMAWVDDPVGLLPDENLVALSKCLGPWNLSTTDLEKGLD